MKIRHPWLVESLSLGISLLIRWWIWSLRYRYIPLAQSFHPSGKGTNKTNGPAEAHKKYLYSFWHENILVPAYQFRDQNISVLISRHADGQMIARAVERLGFTTVRGSSTRGGVEAIKGMVRTSRNQHIAITPDGPKGPRRRVQVGVAFIASRSGQEVVTFGVGYASAWRLKSWDRFVLPVPFGKVILMTGQAIFVPPDLNEEQLEHYRLKIQAEMDRVQTLAEEAALGRMPAATTESGVSKAA